MAAGKIDGRAKRRRPSTVDRLDPEIRELIAQLRIDHGWTIDEIKGQLIKIGQGHISRSALGRHIRTIEDVGAELRETAVYAEALANRMGESSQSRLMDVNAQLLHAQMFKLMIADKDGAGVQLDAKETRDLTQSLKNLADARAKDFDLLQKEREAAAKAAREQAATDAVDVARAKGLSKETVDAIRYAVLGAD